DGKIHQKEVMRHPGSVALLPLLDDGRIVLIENYRAALGRRLLEVPAGTREPEEAPEITAKRELQEETGYVAETLTPICGFYSLPGITDEFMHVYLATGLRAGPANREVTEEIENRILTVDAAMQLLRDGTINDAKTMIALWAYAASQGLAIR
ncbi:MAG: NUDIX hydrolase, partial [Planctomycetota bacterium]